jgi:hypothetical protein
MATLTLSLVSHTNAGKTTLARTLLRQDVGEVRDAPHVTEWASTHELIGTVEGDRLCLSDTPGFGDSARLVRRLEQQGTPLGWLLSQVWDRWRDRPFWASQRALRHVQSESDVVLYLVNAAESPAAAGYVQPEMRLLAWVGKPVLVLLNQLGTARSAADEAADVAAWRAHLAAWPLVQAVLPLDAFARCWVHEATLLASVQAVLQGDAAAAMGRLAAAWAAQGEARFEQAMSTMAGCLARAALSRQEVPDAGGRLTDWSGHLRSLQRMGTALAGRPQPDDHSPAAMAQQALQQAFHADLRTCTTALVALHGLQGEAGADVMARLESVFTLRAKVPEGRAAVLGGAVTGAVAGLKADIVTGGLTLGGGMLAGGLLGALGAAGVARGINIVRGTGQSWVAWSDEALEEAVQSVVLSYLAVAHFGRGRGEWTQSEAPATWLSAVSAAVLRHRSALQAAWRNRTQPPASPGSHETLQEALRTALGGLVRDVLQALYPASRAV